MHKAIDKSGDVEEQREDVKYYNPKWWTTEFVKGKVCYENDQYTEGTLRISLTSKVWQTAVNIRMFASGHPEKPSS